MKSTGLARRVAALGASTAMLAAMVTGLMAGSASAATAGKATAAESATNKTRPSVSVSTPKATNRDYVGSCPTKVNFSGKIKVKLKGKTEVAYRWLHGDGSKSGVKVIKVSGKGTKTLTVRQSITFKGDVKGWEAIQVLGPKKVTSKKGYFSVNCFELRDPEPDYRVSVRAWAQPDTYVGPCTPGDKIDFVGKIRVNSPRWVHYRWILNGDVVDGGKVKVWDERKVGFGFSPRSSHRGWAVLEVLGRHGNDSSRAHYKVWCKDETPAPATKVSVATPVTASNHADCPVGKVGAHADISATGPGRVRYVWKLNGSQVGSGSVDFNKAGTENVSLSEQTLKGDAATSGGTITIVISGPNNHDSSSQSYVAPCKATPSVTVSGPTKVGQRDDQCSPTRGPGVDFAATLHSTGPTTVKYHWLVNGKRDGVGDLSREVNGSLGVTWGIGGTHGATETTGSIQLVVTSPVSVSSGTTVYVATCPPVVKEDAPKA